MLDDIFIEVFFASMWLPPFFAIGAGAGIIAKKIIGAKHRNTTNIVVFTGGFLFIVLMPVWLLIIATGASGHLSKVFSIFTYWMLFVFDTANFLVLLLCTFVSTIIVVSFVAVIVERRYREKQMEDEKENQQKINSK